MVQYLQLIWQSFNSPLSASSSCSSSPFSSSESSTDLDLLDMPMFFPSEFSYPQLLTLSASDDLLLLQHQHQQQQLQIQHQAQSLMDQQQHQLQAEMASIGLGTPPTSPSASFHLHKHHSLPLLHASNPSPAQRSVSDSSTQTAFVYSTSQPASYPSTMAQVFSSFAPQHQQHPQQQQPYAESPLLLSSGVDFDLFPIHSASNSHPSTPLPILHPSPVHQLSYSEPNSFTPQLAMAHSLAHSAVPSLTLPTTMTDPQMMCSCPDRFPCGHQIQSMASMSLSHAFAAGEDVERCDSRSGSGSVSEEEAQAGGSVYSPRASSLTFQTHPRSGNDKKARPKSMNVSSSLPYDSPFHSSSSTPSSPKGQTSSSFSSAKTTTMNSSSASASSSSSRKPDRRRSASGSYAFGATSSDSTPTPYAGHGGGGHPLLEPEMVPEITDIHVCPVCQRRFTRPFNLRSHIMTHTTARPYPCEECHWKFTRQHDLLRHKKAKHPNSVPHLLPPKVNMPLLPRGPGAKQSRRTMSMGDLVLREEQEEEEEEEDEEEKQSEEQERPRGEQKERQAHLVATSHGSSSAMFIQS